MFVCLGHAVGLPNFERLLAQPDIRGFFQRCGPSSLTCTRPSVALCLSRSVFSLAGNALIQVICSQIPVLNLPHPFPLPRPGVSHIPPCFIFFSPLVISPVTGSASPGLRLTGHFPSCIFPNGVLGETVGPPRSPVTPILITWTEAACRIAVRGRLRAGRLGGPAERAREPVFRAIVPRVPFFATFSIAPRRVVGTSFFSNHSQPFLSTERAPSL